MVFPSVTSLLFKKKIKKKKSKNRATPVTKRNLKSL